MDVTFFLTLMPQSSSDFRRRKSGAAPGRPPSPAAMMSFPSSPFPLTICLSSIPLPCYASVLWLVLHALSTQLSWESRGMYRMLKGRSSFSQIPVGGVRKMLASAPGLPPRRGPGEGILGPRSHPSPKKAFSVCAHLSVSRHFCYILCLPVCLCQ